MIYLTPPTTGVEAALLVDPHLGAMTTPDQGNDLERVPGATWAADNGCFGAGYPGDAAWLEWLASRRYDRGRCLWATAPDVVGDAEATLKRSAPFLPVIRRHGYRAAFVAQNGLTPARVPWGDLDVLFVGGDVECPRCGWIPPRTARPKDRETWCASCSRHVVEWKVGPAARELVDAATSRGVPVHMGRVNSLKRLDYAHSIGCASVDGTFIIKGPDRRLPQMRRWLARVHDATHLFDPFAQAVS